MNQRSKPGPNDALATRPGWSRLSEAAAELHAAELLARDPLAAPATVVPHLREFWRAITAAAVAAGIGERDAAEPESWLAAAHPGLELADRSALLGHWRSLAGERAPSKRELVVHSEAARSLLARLEPEIGGVPLVRRKRRIQWAVLGVIVLLTPLALYVALNTEVPGSGPWRAAYYPDPEFEGRPTIVREDLLDHDWGDGAPHDVIPPDKFSVRWDTCLDLEQAGPVVFQVNANDGARVYINGEQVIDAWERDPVTNRRGFGSAELYLDAGVHHLRVDYYESLGEANIKLSASLDQSLPGPLSREHLRYPGDDFDEDDPCAAVR
jgi:hypothetical protein